jgi:acyl dehydratase
MIDKKWIGYELPAATMEIERGRLRFFAKAIGELEPIYTDVKTAREAGYPDLPAPPTFLFGAELDAGTLEGLLDTLGIPIGKILHGEQGFTYHRPVCAGETITVRSKITDIYDKKGGALEFIVKTAEARNENNELVAELRTSIVVRN